MEQVFVSVIIPVFNDAERLRLCLQALESQSYPKSLYEVVVVDNGSAESVEPIVSEFNQARACSEERLGSYAARNKGLSLAKGEIIAFTDSDCIPAPDWIEKGVVNLQLRPDCGLLGGNIEIFFKDAEHPTAVELYESITALQQEKNIETFKFGATANLFTRRNIFDRVGLFNAEMKSGGDREWGRRVHAHGYELMYADEVRIAHPARHNFRELYCRHARFAGGSRFFQRKQKRTLVATVKGAIRDLLPPVRAGVSALRENELDGAGKKLKILTVIFFVNYVQAFERLRLVLGGATRR